jgi:hypothetical protein
MRPNTNAVRKNMYFSSEEVEVLSKMAKEKSITFSEIVRRILDNFIDIVKKENEKST